MKLSRRNFLKFCGINAVALGLSSGVLSNLEQALATGEPKVIWLQGASCSGCTISTLNLLQDTGIKNAHDLLVDTIDLQYHGTVMGLAGDEAQEKITNAGNGFILVVEGAIPTAFNGEACVLWEDNGSPVTVKDALIDLAGKASAIVCAGTCASFGGIPAAGPNPAAVKKVSDIISQDVINIPGCPVHPERLVLTLAKLIAGETVRLLPDGKSIWEGQDGRCHSCHDHGKTGLPANHPATNGKTCQDAGCHSVMDKLLLPSDHPSIGKKPCATVGCHDRGQHLDDEDEHNYLVGQDCSSCHTPGDFDDDDDDDRSYSSFSSSSSRYDWNPPSSSKQSCTSCHSDKSSHIPTREMQLYGTPFDNQRVPATYFKSPICPCSRQVGGLATTYGSSSKCQYDLGCRGSLAFSDCPTRKWHGGITWCMEANAPCTACVHPAFPDASNRALLKVGKKASGVFMEEEKEPVKPPVQKATTLAPIMKLLMD